MVDVGTVRIALAVRESLLGWSATQEIAGPSIAAEPRASKTPRTTPPAELRWVRRRWKPTVTPSPVST